MPTTRDVTTDQLAMLARLDAIYTPERFTRRLTSGPERGAFWVTYTPRGALAATATLILKADGAIRRVERS